MAVDDAFGLWELLWALRTQFPGTDDRVLVEAAASALDALVADGLVILMCWNPCADTGLEIARDKGRAILAATSNWRPPETSAVIQFRFTATEAGKQAYFSNPAIV